MPASTLWLVVGSWLVLAGLSLLAYRFNRNRSDD
jgi:hypothetical protein